MNTYHIHITGIVQGVGFRPFVFNLAAQKGLHGWVNNTENGVHIKFNADEEQAQDFYRKVLDSAPRLSRISDHQMEQVPDRQYHDFQIIESSTTGNLDMPVTPDFALCEDCRTEIHDPAARRLNYAFTTCTNCGPRYSIIQQLPYDRPVTTMKKFAMCPECQHEYEDPANRRYYSQTNSCKTCGIALSLYEDEKEQVIASGDAIKMICDRIIAGQILAIKGIGGYLLICDANNKKTIEKLRTKKHRPTKPFAIMYPNLEAMKQDAEINNSEQQTLLSEVAPILLLKKKLKNALSIQDKVIAPGLNRIGCMLPYAPLFELLLHQLGRPVIATSGNVSGSPIIFEDKLAIAELSSIADAVISNNRPIVVPQDDSVVAYTTRNNKKIIHRRSRGLAPNYFNKNLKVPATSILALGAQMKSSFALVNKQKIYISQYLGDMDNYLTQEAFENTLEHLLNLFNTPPEIILVDKHPNYFTTQLGEQLARKFAVPLIKTQHHKAHFAAVLAENNIIESSEPILGVIWDGTGYGDDGQIWGGEFFIFHDHQIDRVSHISPFPAILGDKMPREPRISALSVGFGLANNSEVLQAKFTSAEYRTYVNLLQKTTTNLTTTSMGRLFDATASILLQIDKVSYEGEAAIQLEALAQNFFNDQPPTFDYSYFASQDRLPADTSQFLLQAVVHDLKNKINSVEIAARFHISLVDLIRRIAQQFEVEKLAFSGGVFQNELLTDLVITLLADDFELLFHHQLSPNDENISFGQIASYWIDQHKKEMVS